METRVDPPHRWLDGLAAAVAATSAGARVEGAISGPGWVSVRIGGRFVWMVAHGADRMAWVTDHPLPRRFLGLLGRHARSPFPAHLGDRLLTGVDVLETDDGQADGLRLVLGPAPDRHLNVRFFPRPGGIWLTGERGEDLARQGRMGERPLHPRPPRPDPDFDVDAHRDRCEAALRARLLHQTARTVRQRVDQAAKRAQRRMWQLEGDLEDARRDQGVRSLADLLAANLHRVEPGRDEIELTGFDGEPVRLELDPSRPPAANLDRWYKKAARAERKLEQVGRRLDEQRAALADLVDRREALEALGPEADLDAWLDLADRYGLDPVPTTPRPASERGKRPAERLPYWTFELEGWELRVGRSARDNDELLKHHAHNRDLWLHAQGVPGSHVILRSGDRDLPRRLIARVAQVAAHYSRAKTSSTVPVLVCERRHVRKPRKAAPGEVIADRAETIFVEPGIPSGCERRDGD